MNLFIFGLFPENFRVFGFSIFGEFWLFNFTIQILEIHCVYFQAYYPRDKERALQYNICKLRVPPEEVVENFEEDDEQLTEGNYKNVMKLALIAEFQHEKSEADRNTKPRDTFFAKKSIDGKTVPYTYTTGLDLGLKVGATIQYTPESGPPFTLTVTQVLNGELILKDLNRKSRENNRHWRGKRKLKKVYFVPNESNFLEKLMAIHMLNDRALGHMFPDKEMDLRENAVVPSFSFISPLNELQRQAVSDTFNRTDIYNLQASISG